MNPSQKYRTLIFLSSYYLNSLIFEPVLRPILLHFNLLFTTIQQISCNALFTRIEAKCQFLQYLYSSVKECVGIFRRILGLCRASYMILRQISIRNLSGYSPWCHDINKKLWDIDAQHIRWTISITRSGFGHLFVTIDMSSHEQSQTETALLCDLLEPL